MQPLSYGTSSDGAAAMQQQRQRQRRSDSDVRPTATQRRRRQSDSTATERQREKCNGSSATIQAYSRRHPYPSLRPNGNAALAYGA